MIKNKEQIIQEKTDKIANRVKAYVEELELLSETEEFTINQIEKKWRGLAEFTEQIYKEINEELIRQLDEKRIIKEKK